MSTQVSEFFPKVTAPLLPLHRMSDVGRLVHHFLNTADWSCVDGLRDALIEAGRERDLGEFYDAVLSVTDWRMPGKLTLSWQPDTASGKWKYLCERVAAIFTSDLVDLDAVIAKAASEMTAEKINEDKNKTLKFDNFGRFVMTLPATPRQWTWHEMGTATDADYLPGDPRDGTANG